jgi:hypothetical protein
VAVVVEVTPMLATSDDVAAVAVQKSGLVSRSAMSRTLVA